MGVGRDGSPGATLFYYNIALPNHDFPAISPINITVKYQFGQKAYIKLS